MLYAILKPLALTLMRLLFGLRSRGRELVPSQGPVLLVANHSSLLDPPLVGGLARRPVSFLAKAELFELPLFGWFLRRLGAKPLRREGGDPGALRMALRVLEAGGVLLVFPEGTRGEEGVLRSPKPGAGMLAVLSGAPVVPVYISGSGRAWPRGRKLPRPAKVTVRFGAPLAFGDNGGRKKEVYEAASREMMAAIARLKDPPGSGDLEAASPRGVEGGKGERAPSASPQYIDGRNGQHGEA